MLVEKIVGSITSNMIENPDVIMVAIAEELLSPIVGDDEDDIEYVLTEFNIANNVMVNISQNLLAHVMVNRGIVLPEEVREYVIDTMAWDMTSRVDELSEQTYSSCEYNFNEVLKDAYELHLQEMFGGLVDHRKCRDMAIDFVTKLDLF